MELAFHDDRPCNQRGDRCILACSIIAHPVGDAVSSVDQNAAGRVAEHNSCADDVEIYCKRRCRSRRCRRWLWRWCNCRCQCGWRWAEVAHCLAAGDSVALRGCPAPWVVGVAPTFARRDRRHSRCIEVVRRRRRRVPLVAAASIACNAVARGAIRCREHRTHALGRPLFLRCNCRSRSW